MEGKVIHCIAKDSVSAIISEARKLAISREDIVTMFTLHNQVYLIYYR